MRHPPKPLSISPARQIPSSTSSVISYIISQITSPDIDIVSEAALRIEKMSTDQPSLLLNHVDQLIRAILMQKRFNFTTRLSAAGPGGTYTYPLLFLVILPSPVSPLLSSPLLSSPLLSSPLLFSSPGDYSQVLDISRILTSVLVQVFSDKTLAQSVHQETLVELERDIFSYLIDDKLVCIENIEQLIRAYNILMGHIVEHSNRNAIFG